MGKLAAAAGGYFQFIHSRRRAFGRTVGKIDGLATDIPIGAGTFVCQTASDFPRESRRNRHDKNVAGFTRFDSDIDDTTSITRPVRRDVIVTVTDQADGITAADAPQIKLTSE